jgi:hypothetical protein
LYQLLSVTGCTPPGGRWREVAWHSGTRTLRSTPIDVKLQSSYYLLEGLLYVVCAHRLVHDIVNLARSISLVCTALLLGIAVAQLGSIGTLCPVVMILGLIRTLPGPRCNMHALQNSHACDACGIGNSLAKSFLQVTWFMLHVSKD